MALKYCTTVMNKTTGWVKSRRISFSLGNGKGIEIPEYGHERINGGVYLFVHFLNMGTMLD